MRGMKFTIHESPIMESGWRGTGYSMSDPNTGARGYFIEGGANGGFLGWWANNGTYVGLAIALTSLLAAVFTVASVLVISLILFLYFPHL